MEQLIASQELLTCKSPIVKTHTFYKENEKWYIDLPESGKSQEELEVIDGGQYMLDYISDGRKKVVIRYSDHKIPRANFMVFLCPEEEKNPDKGASYRQYYYDGQDMQVDIPFCDTIKQIFGYYPAFVFWEIM